MTQQARPERITHSSVQDIALPPGTLALVTLDNGHRAPNTFGPAGLAELTQALRRLSERAQRGEIIAVAITSTPGSFIVGADVTQAVAVTTPQEAWALGEAGHLAYGLLAELPVPTFAFVGGMALGGGLELALHCDHRTVAADVSGLGLPEISLGLVPGWGGSFLLPHLVGVDNALDIILTRADSGRQLTAQGAESIGLVDAVLDPADFLAASLSWAEAILHGELAVARRPTDDPATWEKACVTARGRLDTTVHGARRAPYRALELVEAAHGATPEEAYQAENAALAELLLDDEMRASVYAFTLLLAAKRPTPRAAQPRPVCLVGIVGAGLMATQIAVLVARQLGVPVIMRDLDDDRTAAGLAAVREAADQLAASGRLTPAEAADLAASVSATTTMADLSACDLVIEAVTEVLDVKRSVFVELEAVVRPDAILATNTSALSVTAMAQGLDHPERVVGLHFFNPVASMPLVEVVRAAQTSERSLATGFEMATRLGKIAVEVADRPGFVVNRLLVLLLGVVAEGAEHGVPVEMVDHALDPLALPMSPFALFHLVGPAVALHVLKALRTELGDRFPAQPGLERIVAEQRNIVLEAGRGGPRRVDPSLQEVFGPPGDTADPAQVLDAVLTALTREIGLMLDEGVVADVRQIDLCLLLGAGWGRHLGGIAPYLDRTGYAARVLGHRLLPDGEANGPRHG